METVSFESRTLGSFVELKEILAVLPKLNIKYGPWLAGGAVRRLIKGEPLIEGDLDIFIGNDAQEIEWTRFLTKRNFEVHFRSKFATTYILPVGDRKYRLQER
jgi:hypothetical protein